MFLKAPSVNLVENEMDLPLFNLAEITNRVIHFSGGEQDRELHASQAETAGVGADADLGLCGVSGPVHFAK